MKQLGKTFVLVVLGLALVAPAAPAAVGSFQGVTLRVQFWGGDDGKAIQKDVVDPFVKDTGANIVVEFGNTSASIAKVLAQKADPQLDVVMLDDVGAVALGRAGALDRLDLARLPHEKEIYPSYIIDNGYGIGFYTYITTIVYNKNLISAPKSWRDLWATQYKAKVIAPTITLTPGLLLTVMAAKLNGGGLDNMAPAWPMLKELKPNIHSFRENRSLDVELLKSGEALMEIDIPYYYKPYVERGYPIAATLDLKEGYFGNAGAVALVKGGKGNRDLAYAFIDRALTARAQTALAHDLWYGPTNPNAKLTPLEERWMIHTPEQYARAISVDRAKLQELRPMIIEKWNAIMQ